jgi:hypothetical protein
MRATRSLLRAEDLTDVVVREYAIAAAELSVIRP